MSTLKVRLLDTSAELRTVLTDLADYNYNIPFSDKYISLFDGATGLSLFYYEVFKITSDEKHLEKAIELFNSIFKNLSVTNFSLSHGSTGVMWLANYYVKSGLLPRSQTDFLKSYDSVIESIIDKYSKDIDPMHGLLSISNYLFSRQTKKSKTILRKILEIINLSKSRNSDGVYWESRVFSPEEGHQQQINMGYAHGNLAILYFISKFIKSKIYPELSKSLFEEGMRFFLSHETQDQKSIFPYRIEGESKFFDDRIAYCYGDLGLACGFASIANNLKSKVYEELALKLAIKCADDLIKHQKYNYDIGLCHGSSGNGYMFLKFYYQTSNPVFLEASLLEFRQLLQLRQVDQGIAGFTSLDYNLEKNYFYRRSNSGFIEGTAGVGLAISSLLSSLENKRIVSTWDQILYLS